MDDYSMEPDLNFGSMTIRSILSNKDLLSHPMKATCTDKDKDYNDVYTDASAAFLGPNIWDKTLSEFKMDYLDLDALLSGSDQKISDCNELNNNEKVSVHLQEQQQHHHHHHHHHNHIPAQDASNLVPARHIPSQPSSPIDDSDSERDGRLYAVDCKFSPTDLALATPPGQEHYDPASTVFPDEELKPQPIIKKSRKNFVPDNLKDDKYWARRHKNNIAAKRSREARRLKENQIVLRASYLEKENHSLKEDVMRLKAENDMLKNQLKEFQS
jgi:leukemia factor-related protein